MKRLPLYPLLVAAYPVLATQAANLQQIPLTALWRPLLIVLLATSALMLIVGKLLQDWDKTALSLTLVLFLYFSYGHVFRTLQKNLSPWDVNRNYLILSSIWASLFVVGPWWIWRMMSQVNENLKRFLNAFAIVVILLPLVQIVLYVAQPLYASEENRAPQDAVLTTAIALQPPETLPDIYYIILDGYGRADVLEEVYDYDNSQFLDFLRNRGFYVAGKSRSNYVQTILSLPSSLNFTYLDALLAGTTPFQNAPRMARAILHSRVSSLLENAGYKTVAISSGFGPSEMEEADVYLTPFEDRINDLEMLLLRNTYLWIVVQRKLEPFNYSHDAHRTRILYALESLETLSVEGPKFVFAHILAPHPPFVFGPEGEWIAPNRDYVLFDGNAFQGTRSEYIAGYRDQLHYISQRLEITIDHILSESATPPIIIIQGDHGPAALVNFLSLENSCIKERMAILNAYYLPAGASSQLYDSITPVNTFRIIFNSYFQANLPLLADENYFSTIVEPYNFANVTTQIEEKCTLDGEVTGAVVD